MEKPVDKHPPVDAAPPPRSGDGGAARQARVYQNPVQPGFFPDPSVLRTGDDFYMVNSTFQYFPAVIISHSRDLVHWRPVGHVVTDPSALNLLSVGDSCGVWAPDISFHEGTYYVFFPFASRSGDRFTCVNYVCAAPSPEGPWTRPVPLGEGGIDPSHFVEEGRHYMLTSPGATLTPLSEDCTRTVGDPVTLWPGSTTRAPEGPHMLKRNGYYYLILAEGGTGMGHRITAARSPSLYGPYEACPHNPILMQTDPEAAIQKTGHGKWIQTAAGEWWVTYLCGRPCGRGRCTLGRETALDPLTWGENGWPVINGGNGPSEAQSCPNLPEHVFDAVPEDRFTGSTPGPKWQFIRNPDPRGWSLKERPGYLRLYTDGADFQQLDRPVNALLQRETAHRYQAETTIEFHPECPEEGGAGLTCYYGWRNHIRFGVTGGPGRRLRLIENRAGEVSMISDIPLAGTGPVHLKVEVDGFSRRFFCRAEKPEYLAGEIADAGFLSDEGVVGEYGFTGTMVGLYASGADPGHRRAADFSCFRSIDNF
ncbi:MAG: glycoside hydrolase family 43 protein [Verrucomicrobia bacterium]|nr:glycoside hydrolase family 43 protein [Verrucomicrobiota bacterium]MCH8527474.1 glycoside hydrolase family 43 protein [Kiritimatiellia bacterium]